MPGLLDALGGSVSQLRFRTRFGGTVIDQPLRARGDGSAALIETILQPVLEVTVAGQDVTLYRPAGDPGTSQAPWLLAAGAVLAVAVLALAYRGATR